MYNVLVRSKSIVFQLVNWLIVIASCVFLIVKLTGFDHYSYLLSAVRDFGWRELYQFAIVVVLLPFNIYLEALKWQKLIAKTEVIRFSVALRAVVAGFVTGFITPNRIGEMAGRMVGVSADHKARIPVYSFINSLTQNIAIAIFGIPAFITFVFWHKISSSADAGNYLLMVAVMCFMMVFLLFFAFKILPGRFLTARWNLFAGFPKPGISDFLYAVFFSAFRFCVFSFQFYVLLKVFGVEISFLQAVVSIPSMYLLVTFTPSYAVAEVLVRTSYAILTVGAFTENTAGVFVTGFVLWVINYIIPMLLGGGVLLSKK